MKMFDRVLLIALVVGVWALVMSPVIPEARNEVNCTFTFKSTQGQIKDGTLTRTTDPNSYGAVNSEKIILKLKNPAITLQSATGSVTCP
jgi:hypothetical protein